MNQNKNSFNTFLMVVLGVLCCTALAVCGIGCAKLTTLQSALAAELSASDPQVQVSVVTTDVTKVVEKVRSSVVEITTESVSSGNSLFGQYVSKGAGSGIVVSEDGYIVTNNHVVESAKNVDVTLVDGQTYKAEIIGLDAATDLAVLKIEAEGLTPVEYGDSNALKVGEPAIAIGNPLGSLGGTVSTGIISALNREITIENQTMSLLQTDAAVNPGNSGGGLFNAEGKLIGIVNSKESSTGIEGLGFAIPVSDAVPVIEELIESGIILSRAALNVALQDVTVNEMFSYTMAPGVYVAQIVRGGAADEAGMKVGDQIVEFDGTEVSTYSEIKKLLHAKKPGDQVEVKIVRSRKEQTIKVTLKSSVLEEVF